MSILTLSEIKSEITAGLGNRTDLANRLNTAIDLSQLRISRLHDFDELRVLDSVSTVVTGDVESDKTISFPTLTNARRRKIYSMRRIDANDKVLAGKLTYVLPKRWDKKIPEPEYYARGYPTHYTVWGNNTFELWRVPDAVYTIKIRLSRWPKLVSVTGEGNPIDLENVDDLIINLSLSQLFHSLGREDKAKTYFGIYSALVKDVLKEDDYNFDDAMSGISVSNINSSRGYDDPFVRSIAGDLGY